MSELIIIGYDDHATAERAQSKVIELQRNFVLNLSGSLSCASTRTARSTSTPRIHRRVSATGGALWGMIIGLLFLVPGWACWSAARGAPSPAWRARRA
ncbi:hypothetical protein [Tessaracoccus coleopterorum]|uniref:hypothetical protein n=1 Tax=Tessaracoccus coleopterorum TaxID=2714950 RepID=UPI0018D33406|nr:hypothetical protein [Tessaracoccus coleopterorum]